MPDLRQQMTQANNPFDKSSRLADLIGGYIDAKNLPSQLGDIGNPTNALNPSFPQFATKLQEIMGVPFRPTGSQGLSQHDARQFGETYNPPEYRGIRFLLPQGNTSAAPPIPGGMVPGYAGLKQQFLGEMIRRGYPVLGGVGQLPGWRQGFDPIGFGQRDIPKTAEQSDDDREAAIIQNLPPHYSTGASGGRVPPRAFGRGFGQR